MSRDLIAYSAGADSTLLLDRFADSKHIRDPRFDTTIALSVDSHPQLDARQLEGQRIARYAYTAWARNHGRVFKQVSLRIDGPDGSGKVGVESESPQATVWFLTLMAYVGSGDRLHLGYIKPDEFWHAREKYVAAFEAVCRMRGVIGAELHFDLEWCSKDSVVQELRARGIPRRALWTCDNPAGDQDTGPRHCQRCEKCVELARALKKYPRVEHQPDPTLGELKQRIRDLESKGGWETKSKEQGVLQQAYTVDDNPLVRGRLADAPGEVFAGDSHFERVGSRTGAEVRPKAIATKSRLGS